MIISILGKLFITWYIIIFIPYKNITSFFLTILEFMLSANIVYSILSVFLCNLVSCLQTSKIHFPEKVLLNYMDIWF